MAEALSLFAKIGLDKTEYDLGLTQASGDMKTFGGALGRGFGTIAKAGALAFGAVTAASGAFVKSSIDAGMSFDSSMSQVAATLGKTTQDLEKEVGEVDLAWGHFSGNLRDYAQEMGAHTAFSATQAADALNYMALAGYDTQKSMRMLPNVLNLAAAGNMDLARASDMVTDASSALGLSEEETALMVDKMAKAASKSNTSVAQLGDAYLAVGGLAKNLRGGTTELSTVLGILADNGIKAAEGGTHLRNMILKLSAPTTKGAKQLEALGVSVFDSEGKMRSFSEFMPELNASLSQLTDQERTKALKNIFNTTDIAAANALLGTSSERWEELTGAIDNAGSAAQEMADTQLDNLPGQITLFKSALEGAQIAISDKLTPTLKDFVKGGTDALSTLTDAFRKGGLNAVIDEFPGLIQSGISEMAKVAPRALDVGLEIIGAIGRGIYNSAPQLISAGVEITGNLLGKLYDAFVDGVPVLMSAGVEVINSLTEGIRENLPELIPVAMEMLLNFSEGLRENVGTLVDAGLGMIMAIADSMIANIPVFIQTVPTIVSNIAGLINDNMPKIFATGVTILVKLVGGIISAIPVIIANLPKIVMAIVNVITAFNWIDLGKNVIKALVKGVKNLASAIPQAIRNIIQTGGNIVKNFGWASLGRGIIQMLVNGVRGLASSIPSALRSIGSRAMSAFRNINWGSVGRNVISGIASGILGGAGKVVSAAKNAASKALNAAKNFLGIKSPSRVFRDQVGLMMAEGMALGFERGVDDKDYEKSINDMIDDLEPEDVGEFETSSVSVNTEDKALWKILSILNTYLPTLSQLQLVMDTNQVVGALAPAMNTEINRINLRQSRREGVR